MDQNIATKILKIFANKPFSTFNPKQIAAKVGAYDKATRQLVHATVLEMAEERILIEEGRGKYKLNPRHLNDDLLPKKYIVGTIDMKQTGKAYVIPQTDGHEAEKAGKPEDKSDFGNSQAAADGSTIPTEDIFIAPNNTNHALHGDTVKVEMFPPRKMHKPEGRVVEVLHRAKTRFVGRIQKSSKFAFLLCDNRNMPVDIFIPLTDLAGAEEGEKAVVEMTDWPEQMNNPVGRVVKRLGKPGDNNVEMQSILAEYDFPLEFPKEVEEEVQSSKFKIQNSDLKSRRDFREVTTFTIDPADAKDFDDAISFQVLKNGNYEVGVHIADVSYYVRPGSAVDREAYERGTSVYLVDRTIPMLPEKLCNDLCSLRPGEDKLCFSAVFEMNDKAEVLSRWFGKTVINSDRRYNYEEAQEIIENRERGTESAENVFDRRREVSTLNSQLSTQKAILLLHKLATILRSQRYKDGAINFESQEVKFQLDENAKPIGVYIKEQKEANWLIEEFMLLANRNVAESIGASKTSKTSRTSRTSKSSDTSKSRVFVYRVHDEPNPEKLNTFVEFVTKLGFKMRIGSRKALADSYNRLFEQIAGRGEEYMIDSIAIRTMSKAYYSTDNIGHYGLAFPFYTHFTSPIRRYPDLMVHRLLEYYLSVSAGGGMTAGGDACVPTLNSQPSTPDKEQYEEYCKHCSIMERKAAEAERASVKYKQAEFLADKLGQVFDANISGVSKWGIYAEIVGNKCEGMIPIGSLKGDYYMLDEDNYQVIGRRSGKCYKLGDSVKIRVKAVDMLKKQIDFELVEEEEEKKTTRKTREPRSSRNSRSSRQSRSSK